MRERTRERERKRKREGGGEGGGEKEQKPVLGGGNADPTVLRESKLLQSRCSPLCVCVCVRARARACCTRNFRTSVP